jgi:hypothetical protein
MNVSHLCSVTAAESGENMRENITDIFLEHIVAEYQENSRGALKTVTEARLAPPRGKQGDKPDENQELKKTRLTFSNFSIVRLSMPPHL